MDQLVNLPKTIGENIKWITDSSRSPRYKFSVTVACPEPEPPLRLLGVVGPVNFSFSLLSLQNQTLRRLNRHVGNHLNPDGSDMGEHHKHIWDDEHENRVSYVPSDIDWSDPNRALAGFLNECNITVLAQIDTLLRQKELK